MMAPNNRKGWLVGLAAIVLLGTLLQLGHAQFSPAKASDIASAWVYDEDVDQMRNAKSYTATLVAKTDVQFSFPYNGGSALMLVLRSDPKFGHDVWLQITKGQFLCSPVSCQVSVKFDDGKIIDYDGTPPNDGDSKYLFIRDYKGFVAHLRKAKALIVEADFYQEGRVQFAFDVPPLDWKH